MKKKRTLKKVTMAAGVVVMSVGLFNSFDLDAQTTGGGSGTTDCWTAYTRGGDYVRRICKLTSSGITENCKVVTDLTNYNGLSTCTP